MSSELPPIRCVTCNKILGNLWVKYKEMIENGERIEIALNKLGLSRPCCRMRIMNPFKVVERDPQTQEDIDKMTCSIDLKAPTEGALSALTSVTAMTIVPEEEESDIVLPPLPSIPSLPSTSERKVSRTYQAW